MDTSPQLWRKGEGPTPGPPVTISRELAAELLAGLDNDFEEHGGPGPGDSVRQYVERTRELRTALGWGPEPGYEILRFED